VHEGLIEDLRLLLKITKGKTMNRIVAVLVIMIFGLLTVAGPVRSEGAKEIRVALQAGPHYGPIFVVKQKGWMEEELKKNGVAVKWASFAAGPPMNEALAAGEEDLGFMGDTPAIIARAAGQDTRIIALTSSAPKALALLVAKNSTILSPKDLKGKKVAVVKGSYAHHLLVLVLQNNGLTVDDVQVVNLSHADIATALVKGEIDAGALWEPLITKLEDEGSAKVLVDGTGIKQGVLVIVARNEFASKNSELVATFLKSYQRGLEFIQANPKEAAGLVAKEVNLTPEQLLKVMAKFDYSPAIRLDAIKELKKSEEFMRDAGIIKTPVDIDAFVDLRYLQSAGIQ